MKLIIVNSRRKAFGIMTLIMMLMFVNAFTSDAQMPPPGYERAKKLEAERMKMKSIDRDTIMMIDTVVVFDPITMAQETKIIEHRISVRDYCVTILGMSDPEILLDGNPHTIIDPETFEDLTIRLNSSGKLDTIPK